MNHEIYTGSSEKVSLPSIESSRPCGRGAYGKVYPYDKGRVIKILTCPGTSEQYDLMCQIKNLHLPSLYRIDEVLWCKSSLGLKTYGGVITEYYPKEKKNVWENSSSYLLEELRKLRESVSLLGENHIRIYDMNSTNLLFSTEGIKVIDADDYKISEEEETVHNLFEASYRVQFSLFDLYREYCRLHHVSNPVISCYQDLDHVDFLSSSFAQKLAGYSRPIDWLEKEVGTSSYREKRKILFR